MDRIFGDDSWRELVCEPDFAGQCRQVLDLYKRRLRTIPNVRCVFSFEMRNRANTLDYFLVFASQHYLGLEKMKESMKRLDQSGDYSFSDAKVAQTALFRFGEPEDFAARLFRQFGGTQVGYGPVRDYALNETPFTNPKSMLKILERQELIDVLSSDPKRRRGTSREDRIVAIRFAPGEPDAHP